MQCRIFPTGRLSRGQRNADALWAMAQDTLNGHNGDNSDRGAPVVTVFVDAADAASDPAVRPGRSSNPDLE